MSGDDEEPARTETEQESASSTSAACGQGGDILIPSFLPALGQASFSFCPWCRSLPATSSDDIPQFQS